MLITTALLNGNGMVLLVIVKLLACTTLRTNQSTLPISTHPSGTWQVHHTSVIKSRKTCMSPRPAACSPSAYLEEEVGAAHCFLAG